jgi:lysophospholipase L1-like esterase
LKHKKKILFLGASITQGKISKSYVRMLKQKLGTKQYKYINQGIAGYESYNVLKNLEKAIKLEPDFVVLLVGTNDVLSSLDPMLSKLSRKLKKIPHEPTLKHFGENTTQIIRLLKENTNSEIAISSLPVVGENLFSLENRTISEYNTELKNIAENELVRFLSVNENQKHLLISKIQGKGKDYNKDARLSYKSLFQHFILFRSLDSISRKNGFLLLTDGIHMNSIGAGIIAEEIEDFIINCV